MLFYSNIYIFFFLPILLITYYLIFKDNNNLKKIIILFSIVFYAWWNVIYLPLIIIIIIINYNFGNLIIRSLNSKKTLLILAVFINILNLFTFKLGDSKDCPPGLKCGGHPIMKYGLMGVLLGVCIYVQVLIGQLQDTDGCKLGKNAAFVGISNWIMIALLGLFVIYKGYLMFSKQQYK